MFFFSVARAKGQSNIRIRRTKTRSSTGITGQPRPEGNSAELAKGQSRTRRGQVQGTGEGAGSAGIGSVEATSYQDKVSTTVRRPFKDTGPGLSCSGPIERFFFPRLGQSQTTRDKDGDHRQGGEDSIKPSKTKDEYRGLLQPD